VGKVIQYTILDPRAARPERATNGAVGFDAKALYALSKETRKKCQDLPAEIEPGGSLLIGTGIAMAVPYPIDCQVRPRSGLANKFDIELSNSPGTVDPDYRGEIGILLRNRGKNPFTVELGMRVAQLVFTEVVIPTFEEVPRLPPSLRDTGGFGSTGMTAIAEGDAVSRARQMENDQYYLNIARAVAQRSNCLRGCERLPDGTYRHDEMGRYIGAVRRVGALIVKDDNIIATGTNMRTSDCSEEKGCVREREHIPSGTMLERGCDHAEAEAFKRHARNGGPSLEGATLYVTESPCLMCVARVIERSGIATVVIDKRSTYPTEVAIQRLRDAGIEVRYA
jgi:dUTP pyrophosphatase